MILCLGEAIVDLVCERAVDSPIDADNFRPRFGGALANVSVAASRAGAEVALAGGVGDDHWGTWLRDRLAAEGVRLDWLSSVPGVRTPVAFITFNREREAEFQVYGDSIAATLCSVDDRLAEALGSARALVFGSNTLVGERERSLTLRARELAADRGLPLLFDPNLRAQRWGDLGVALDLCRKACAGTLVTRANLAEGRWLAGLGPDAAAEEAADAILDLGARIAVVTRGELGAVMRGAASAEHPGVDIEEVSSLGAGDAFMGTLTARLAGSDFDLAHADDALTAACEAGARACTVWQAVP